MRRQVFDMLASLGGLVVVVTLVVAGGLAMWGYSFANSSVHPQLAQSRSGKRPLASAGSRCARCERFFLEDLWIRHITVTTGLVDTYSTPTSLTMLGPRSARRRQRGHAPVRPARQLNRPVNHGQ